MKKPQPSLANPLDRSLASRMPWLLMTLGLLVLNVVPLAAQADRDSAQLTGDLGTAAATDALLFFAIPDARLSDGPNTATVLVHAGDALLAKESFSKLVAPRRQGDASHLVLEAFAEQPELRRQIHAAAAGSRAQIMIEVQVNHELLQRTPYEQRATASGHALTLAAPSTRVAVPQQFAAFDPSRPLTRIPICGNGVCESNDFPPESCETCPQDCGGPCTICGNGICSANESCESCEADCGACPDCPTDLDPESRTQRVWVDIFGGPVDRDCWLDHRNPSQQVEYIAFRTLFRTFTVDRVLECDGTITETVQSGSTTYFWDVCWARTETRCNGKKDWIPPCTIN